MNSRKFAATLAALVVGIALSVSHASAGKPPYEGTAGYLQGDPAPGKLIPYYAATGTTATAIGIENTIGNDGPEGAELDIPIFRGEFPAYVHISGGDILIRITVFDRLSNEVINVDKCLSPFDFAYIVLQEGPVTEAETDNLDHPTGPFTTRRDKSIVFGGGIPTEGYVSIRATRIYGTKNGTCAEDVQFGVSVDIPDPQELVRYGYAPLSLPLATWAMLLDISSGFYGTEIPTLTARVDPYSGTVYGGIGAFGLIPAGNEVIARFDVNPVQGSRTIIFVWLAHNNGTLTGYLDCEDELEISAPVELPYEVNHLHPGLTDSSLYGPLGFCRDAEQYRGVLRFTMPDTGFLWSHISQEGLHYQENFLGYNLQNNQFIDCADGYLDFGIPYFYDSNQHPPYTPPLCNYEADNTSMSSAR